MFKTNKNEKIIKLAFSLNTLINKIENNIEIIDEVSYTKLVSKFEDMFKKKEDMCKNTDTYRFFLSGIYSSLNLVLSNGTFDIIDSIEQLSEENFRDYILIKNICQKGKHSCSDSVKVEMKSQLNNLFFTEEGRLHIKEVCNNCINIIIDLYAVRNLTAVAYNNQIPYSIASNEQKIYYWLAKYIPDELIYYITEYYLNNYDETINIKEFQKDFVKFIFDETIWYQETEAINDAFLKLEDENLLSSLYSFCTAFLKLVNQYNIK